MSQRRLSFQRVVQMTGLAAIPLILLLVSLILSREFAQNRVLTQEVVRSYETRAQLQRILSSYQDMETGQRGFVITGDANFLEPYQAARRRLNAELSGLGEPGATTTRRQLPALLSLSMQKLAFMERTIEARRGQQLEEAMRLVASRQGKELMDGLRAMIAGMDAAEARGLTARTAAANAARRRTQQLAFALQASLVVLLLIAAWLILRSMAARRDAMERYRDLSTRQEAIFDSAKDGMMLLDDAGVIQNLNPAAARMYGYAAEEMIGRSVAMLAEAPPSAEEVAQFLSQLPARDDEGFGRVREFASRRKDGTVFPTDVAVSPVSLASGQSYVAIVRDITYRKQIEQMKTEFVSTVSHELRTPLTSIAGSLGLLRGGAVGAMPERAQRLVTIAHENSERLIRLINDILDVEKMESGKIVFDLRHVSLKTLLARAVESVHGFAAGFNVRLDLHPVPDDAAVVADEDRLMQVITNLLSNAAKFSPPGDVVEIWVTSSAHSHRVTVADNGPGIPEAFRDRIFGKFAQADSSDNRQKGGTGLGLNIAREIVTRLGGSISFDSTPGEGTAFHVDLPAVGHVVAEPRIDREHRVPGLPRILHVDDDSDTLRLVASVFEGKAELLATPSVQEARAALMRDAFDAAILDIAMTDGSGLDLLPLLSAGERKTPTIIFTARDSNPALLASADAVLTKSRASLEQVVEVTMAAIAREADAGRGA